MVLVRPCGGLFSPAYTAPRLTGPTKHSTAGFCRCRRAHTHMPCSSSPAPKVAFIFFPLLTLDSKRSWLGRRKLLMASALGMTLAQGLLAINFIPGDSSVALALTGQCLYVCVQCHFFSPSFFPPFITSSRGVGAWRCLPGFEPLVSFGGWCASSQGSPPHAVVYLGPTPVLAVRLSAGNRRRLLTNFRKLIRCIGLSPPTHLSLSPAQGTWRSSRLATVQSPGFTPQRSSPSGSAARPWGSPRSPTASRRVSSQ